MKKIKKNLFGIGLALAIIMGIGFSFVTKSAKAEYNQYCEFAAYTYWDDDLELYVTYCPNYVAPNAICLLPCFLINDD